MLRKLAPLSLLAVAFATGCGDGSHDPVSPDVRPVFDKVYNGLDASIDAVAEVMPLTVGGANGATTLYIDPTNGDGKNGCNLTGSTTLVVSVVSSATGVATVSPSSITFGSCDGSNVLTITPVGPGSATISLTQTSNTTGGSFQLAEAGFTVNVTAATPTNTAPTILITGVTGGFSYDKGSVPAAVCEVTDAEDGNQTFAATLSAIAGPYAADGIGEQKASCSYTDEGDLTAVSSLTYDIVDPSPPSIGRVLTPASPDGAHGWHKSDVTLTWTVTENESPNSLVVTGCVDQSIAVDQVEQTYSCSATSAGGPADEVSVSIKRDATAPSVSFVGGPEDGASYYFGSVPAAPTCAASDATSGLAGACAVSGYGTTVGPHTVAATATDNAGNQTTRSVTYTVKAWTLSGFYAPVDMKDANGKVVFNTVKGGSTVPLKFEVFAGIELTSTTVITSSFKVGEIACGSINNAVTDDIEQYSTGGTSLRYDATGGQFIQNWQTPRTSGKCYQTTLTTQDGSRISAYFMTR